MAKLVLLPDGSSLGVERAGTAGIVRFSATGQLDSTFPAGGGAAAPGKVSSLVVQPNGQAHLGAAWDSSVVRINGDGTTDSAFSSAQHFGTFFIAERLALQADGKILVAGFSPEWPYTVVRLLGDTVIPPPMLAGFMESPGFGIQVAASNANQIVLEASSTLTDWTPVSTNLVTDGAVLLLNPEPGGFSRRFYRVLTMP